MKKTLSLLLVLVLSLSLCACGGESKAENENSGAASAFDGIGSNFNPDIDIESVTVSPGNKIDIDLPDMDFDIDIEPVTVTPGNGIEVDLPDFDYEFTIEPVEVQGNGISFEFADYDFTIDTETFNVNEFAQESGANFSEEDKEALSEMDTADVVAIAETRANLLADLAHAFKTSGLAVNMDEEQGEIMLDSSVLFAVDKSEISAEGKEFLKKFISVYTTVVFNPKYEGFVSRVMVEGHTDSDGDYDYNKTLSQKRAESVMAFCLSEESSVDAAYIAELQDTLEAIGYSCDRLIYDENGNEDKAASRRVSFRFLIALP